MYTLGIDTTGKICGVALTNNDKVVFESNKDSGLTHSVTLFPNICKALNKAKITIKDLDKIRVSCGPGSFTGLRIGIATALSLAIPYNTRLEYVDTLKALAYNSLNKADFIISIMDARASRVYISIFDNKLNKILIDQIVDIDNLINLLNKYFAKKDVKFIFTGDAVNVYDSKLKLLKCKYIIEKNNLQKAGSVCFTSGKVSKLPITNYLIASKAEREKNAQDRICKKR